VIAADTSSLIAWLAGDDGDDVERLAEALQARRLHLPPPVVTELTSGAAPDTEAALLIARSPLIPLAPDFWLRAGASRRLLLGLRLKARLADALIAQCCIDAGVALITRDADFRHFAEHCGLQLAV
jgi:predicted nucleic acid-binding protein